MTTVSSAPQHTQVHDGQARTRDGIGIAYGLTDAGAGAPRIALVHSLAMERGFWRPVAERLAGAASVLTFDCRGHGASGKPDGPYTVELFADDLADLLDHVGWGSAAIAGASMGGCVSLAFAARYPQRTAGLGLIDTTACYDAMPAWMDRANKAKQGGLASLVGFQITRWFGDAFRAEHEDVVQESVDVFLRNDVAAYAETCRMLGACDLRAALPSIKTPTTVIVGEEDYATPVKTARELHDGVAGSTLTVLKGGRHLTPIEQPEPIAAELLRIAREGRAA
ncbi:MAG: alpha/beta fold hydrolase [Rhizobiales bacterium]|nr:alpha/beta fold hydrolase [Hyphomicrobiales bacterium]